MEHKVYMVKPGFDFISLLQLPNTQLENFHNWKVEKFVFQVSKSLQNVQFFFCFLFE